MTKSLLHLPFAFCLLTSYFSHSQSDVLKYAHQIVDTLASPSMHGRGYVMKGDSIAADYIKKEFQKLGVKPLGRELYQRFSFPVNTFPGEVVLEFDEKKLTPGKDFILGPNSTNWKGKEKVLLLNKNNIEDSHFSNLSEKEFCKKMPLLDTSGFTQIDHNLVDQKIIYCDMMPSSILEKEKLTSDLSSKPYGCTFHILKNSLPINSRKVSFEVDQKFIPNYQSQNVIGYIQGTQYRDSIIVFTAHYDHLGMMGKDVYFPGANDNASGCAMLLNLAKYYSEHKPKYSIAFMAFGAEEVGLIGSNYYIEHQLFNINQIKFLINFDIVGTGDEGIKVVNATEHKKEFDELVKINEEKKYLPSVQPRGKAHISDHYFFEEAGVKTFYIYTLGGIKAYHDIYDRRETLPLTKFEELFHLVTDFTDQLQR